MKCKYYGNRNESGGIEMELNYAVWVSERYAIIIKWVWLNCSYSNHQPLSNNIVHLQFLSGHLSIMQSIHVHIQYTCTCIWLCTFFLSSLNC